MDTLYYDSRCPLCLREMRLLQRISDDSLVLTDIHKAPAVAGEPARLLKLSTLHLRTGAGQWLTGVEAVVRVWSHTPYGFFFKLLRWPLIGSLADWCYGIWAQRRYRRLYGCEGCTDS